MIPAEIHPGPGAGNGKLEPRRTTYAPGDRQVELRRCAQCGFFNRDKIDSVGDSSDSVGIQETSQAITNTKGTTKLPQHLINLSVASPAGLKFSTASLTYTFPAVVAGCRFCGSLNSIGKNRNWKDFGTGKDLSHR